MKSWFTCAPRSPIHIGRFTHHLWFIVGLNGAWYEAREPVQHFMFSVINKRKTSTSADGYVLNLVIMTCSIPELYCTVWMENTAQLRRFPNLLKTVKIKQAKTYYRSLKEHCWVSREQETEREREREREIMLVRIWPSQCVQKWKAWNWIPTFLWLYDKRVRNAAALHMSFHTTLAQPAMVVCERRSPPSQNKTVY